jgi:hypothetical protein
VSGNRPYILGESTYVTTLAFMQLFQGIEVRNFAERFGETTRRIPVQVSLDTKERLYYQLKHGGFRAMEQQDTRLPRISIQMNDIALRLEDYTGKGQDRILFRDDDEIKRDIQPVPVNITYTVAIWAKYFEHYIQIVENIVPLFDPYATVEVKERQLDIAREISYTLDGLSNGSTFKVSGDDQRVVRGEANFTAKSIMYKIMNENTYDLITKVYGTLIDIETPVNSMTVGLSGFPPL